MKKATSETKQKKETKPIKNEKTKTKTEIKLKQKEKNPFHAENLFFN